MTTVVGSSRSSVYGILVLLIVTTTTSFALQQNHRMYIGSSSSSSRSRSTSRFHPIATTRCSIPPMARSNSNTNDNNNNKNWKSLMVSSSVTGETTPEATSLPEESSPSKKEVEEAVVVDPDVIPAVVGTTAEAAAVAVATTSSTSTSNNNTKKTNKKTIQELRSEGGRFTFNTPIGALNPFAIYYGVVSILLGLPWFVACKGCQFLYWLSRGKFDPKVRRRMSVF